MTKELPEKYINDANNFIDNGDVANAILAIRKALVEDPRNPRAHFQSMLIHQVINRNDHAVLHGIFAKNWTEYPEKWFYYAIHACALFNLSREYHILGCLDADQLLVRAVDSFEEAYKDNPEMVRQKFSKYMFLIESLTTLQKIEVNFEGPIPFKMYSAIQDFRSCINMETLVGHLQNKIEKYGSLIPYIIQDLQGGVVGHFNSCNQVSIWKPDSNRGTLATRMINRTSKGGILLMGNDSPLLIENIVRVYESFLPIDFKSLHPHSSITFIEAKDKYNQILRYALLDPVTFNEKKYNDVLGHYLYIQREESKSKTN
ncbi:hypothetical protein ACQKL5_10810 [Peribacillus sp. NPDC097675]|uniref:hypothetical protein n=1 Tax=Peribacillus sp. NPDC097675 TaxID=3390618 RepID=UPI003D07E1E2